MTATARPSTTGDAEGSPPPVVLITLGDPAGIGPEITAKALAGPAGRTLVSRPGSRVVVIGDEASLRSAAEAAGLAPCWRVTEASRELAQAWMRCEHDAAARLTPTVIEPTPADPPSGLGEITLVPLEWPQRSPQTPHGPSAWGGRVSFEAVDLAIAMAQRVRESAAAGGAGGARRCAIVTAPISKTAWHMARDAAESEAVRLRMGGPPRWPNGFPGHTELLAERFEAPESGMMFFGPSMRVALATVHVPLMAVSGERGVLARDPGVVLRAVRLAHRGCRMAGVERPRIAVCGVNPHAGEGGLLGDEDDRFVAPQVRLAQREGIDAHGPLPADTLFARALLKDGRRVRDDGFDAVVAMYHDQGLIPCKLVDGYRAVNVTVGLQDGIIRTSPAHGTAYDIAGRNVANAESMEEAVAASATLNR